MTFISRSLYPFQTQQQDRDLPNENSLDPNPIALATNAPTSAIAIPKVGTSLLKDIPEESMVSFPKTG